MHKAKEYLLKYQAARRRAERIERQIRELKEKYSLPSAIQYSDMPKSPNVEHDLSEYAAKLDELVGYLVKTYSVCIGIEGDILKRLDSMEDETERELLRMRYIKMMDWKEIITCMPYSERSVYYIHGRALNHFPLPE